MWDARFIKLGGVEVPTHPERIRLEWNVWNLRHPGEGASTLGIQYRLHLTGPPCVTVRICRQEKTMAVPKCCIAAQRSHVFPNSMAMLCLEPAARGDNQHRDGRGPLERAIRG